MVEDSESRDAGNGAENTDPTGRTTDDRSETETEQLLTEIERRRTVRGLATVAVSMVGIGFSLFQIAIASQSLTFRLPIPYTDASVTVFALQQLQANAIHVGFALVLAFLLFPPTDGTGPIASRLGATADRFRAGVGGSAATAVDRLRGAVRWFAVDPSRNRVTPLDLVLIALSLATPLYMFREFDEIRSMRVRGLTVGRSIGEVYPLLEAPAALVSTIGVPLDEYSYAMIIGVVGVLLVLEATRRALGNFLMLVVGAFIVYARWGYLIPRRATYLGILSIPELSWENIIRNLWFTTEGIFGIPVTVSVRFIYIFILFGAFLEMSGAGKWFIDFAYALTGHRRGGPAKASVVSSGFMGMLSGSSIANTVTTGAFTIPLMKRSGYSSEFAGAVEASSSSGGQILPPVMGAAAFLIVEYTGTPYRVVIIAASVPAIAFFFGMWVMVHFEAMRHGIGGLDRSELPRTNRLLRTGWFYLVPVALLLYFLIGLRLSVGRSGWYTIVAIVALVAFIAAYNGRNRFPLVASIVLLYAIQVAAHATVGVGVVGALVGDGADGLPLGEALRAAAGSLGLVTILVSLAFVLWRPRSRTPHLELDDTVLEAADRSAARLDRPSLATHTGFQLFAFLVKALDSGARTAVTVVIAVAAAGVIPGVISVSGLGPNLTSLILAVSGESLVIMLLLAGVSAIILGLGMPTTVMYILLISMLGGALEQLGVALLAAHLFVLYFGLMADVTPPVAVAAYAAAGVAKADEFATGVTAFLLSLNKVMVPFAFIFTPGVLLLRFVDGEWTVLGVSDLLDLDFFLLEVLVPIVGLFAGVFALSITIIGFYDVEVGDVDRSLYAVASLLLMVPDLILLPGQRLSVMVGTPLVFDTLVFDLVLRGAGAALLILLIRHNSGERNRQEPERADATGSPTTE